MKRLSYILIALGAILISVSLILFVYIFGPVVKVELTYNISKPSKTIDEIKPVNKEFGIVIPKIGANSKIIEEVDPFNPKIYQYALSKGVAQAKGTAYPDQVGNMFLFSHSSVNLLEATRYNSVFYLLSKLSKEDEIYIYYKRVKYKYKVSQIKIVDAKDISYLNSNSNKKMLTLMTCWPAGTNYKRLLIISNFVN